MHGELNDRVLLPALREKLDTQAIPDTHHRRRLFVAAARLSLQDIFPSLHASAKTHVTMIKFGACRGDEELWSFFRINFWHGLMSVFQRPQEVATALYQPLTLKHCR